MRKKVLAVLAALMVLTMSFTVFAAESITANNATGNTITVASDAKTPMAVNAGGVACPVGQVSDAQVATIKAVIDSVLRGQNVTIGKIFDIGAPAGWNGQPVTLTVPGLDPSYTGVIHLKSDGTTEYLPITNGSFTTSSFSPFAFVKTNNGGIRSPKTGEL